MPSTEKENVNTFIGCEPCALSLHLETEHAKCRGNKEGRARETVGYLDEKSYQGLETTETKRCRM